MLKGYIQASQNHLSPRGQITHFMLIWVAEGAKIACISWSNVSFSNASLARLEKLAGVLQPEPAAQKGKDDSTLLRHNAFSVMS